MLYDQFKEFYAPHLPAPTSTLQSPHPARPSKPQNRWMETPLAPGSVSAPDATPLTALGAIDAYLGSPLAKRDSKANDGGLLAYWT
ncbi:hypothetical protein FRC06_005869 [Ceratobasidium sp. 370]|nr:hypothetical protein FRC06_005869 [Ceratobasidium sp. 370]